MVMVGMLSITHSGLYDGLNVFAGLSSIEQNATLGDKDSEAYGATYAIGGATVGYQHSKEDNVGAAGTYYENDAYAISYSVNDDLAISYGVHESDQTVVQLVLSGQLKLNLFRSLIL